MPRLAVPYGALDPDRQVQRSWHGGRGGGDSPADWLTAGVALQRVLLTATLRGLAATPLSQIVEIPRLRTLLADSLTGQVVQTVLRIGYPTTPARPTARRPLHQTVLIGE